jgi:hypothetical protein
MLSTNSSYVSSRTQYHNDTSINHQTVDPTPARFARLVTQLKWRLLEGQGQAYYEIGVADSGLLIGLTKRDLEKSIETLEEMAGEIGASVIIVKEVEVPESLVQLAEQAIRSGEVPESAALAALKAKSSSSFEDDQELWRPGLGAWDRRSKRAEVLKSVDSFSSSVSTTTTTSNTETETETDDFPTDDDTQGLSDGRTFQALDFNDLLALDDCGDEADHEQDADGGLFPFDPEIAPESFSTKPHALALDIKQPSTTSLSIASVFKPRPRRRRPPGSNPNKLDRRQQKLDARLNFTYVATKATAILELPIDHQLTKNDRRRIARDRRRDSKRRALMSGAVAAMAEIPRVENDSISEPSQDAEVSLVVDDSAVLNDVMANVSIRAVPEKSACTIDEVAEVLAEVIKSSEPRLIVEALVVRKLSIGAATYGDFGFSFDFE